MRGAGRVLRLPGSCHEEQRQLEQMEQLERQQLKQHFAADLWLASWLIARIQLTDSLCGCVCVSGRGARLELRVTGAWRVYKFYTLIDFLVTAQNLRSFYFYFFH